MKTPKILNSIDEKTICYFQSSTNYTLLLLENGKTIISGYTIKVFEALYENRNFIKVNRSNLINISFIQKVMVENNTCSLVLFNGEAINVSRRRINNIKSNFPSLF